MSVSSKKPVWQQPWGFPESFLILLGLLLSGTFLEYSTPKVSVLSVHWPYTILIVLGSLSLLLFISIRCKQTHFVVWLSSVYAAVPAIVGFLCVLVLMGIFHQSPNLQSDSFAGRIGVHSVLTTYYFFLLSIYFLSCLAMATIKNSMKFQRNRWGVLLSHLGLFIIALSLSLGRGDVQKVHMELTLYQKEWRGYFQDGTEIEFPFVLELTDFAIDEFNPKLAVINRAGVIIDPQTSMFEITDSATGMLRGWKFEVLKYLTYAYQMESGVYQPVFQQGAAPAALLRFVHSGTGVVKEQWISCGSFMVKPSGVAIDDSTTFVMALPEVKKYRSTINLYRRHAESTVHILEVNKPLKIEGWKVYQLDYDSKMGRWSQKSVIELVRDPWLPVVYSGIGMMLAGALSIFWIGNSKIRGRDNVE